MATPQAIENQQLSHEVFEKKHYMECTTSHERFDDTLQGFRTEHLVGNNHGDHSYFSRRPFNTPL
jgi:hypothetical protein